ncbi:hypothetical protein FA95DRAFT_1565659, partial [Auriscalpium vulgare]
MRLRASKACDAGDAKVAIDKAARKQCANNSVRRFCLSSRRLSSSLRPHILLSLAHSRLPLKTSHMLHELALCFATAACSSLPVLRPTPVAVCGSLSRSLHAVAGSSLRTSRFLLKTGTQCRREHDASRARNL